MAMPTLLDIAKANGSDALVGLIDETTQAAPEVRSGAARTVRGLSYKTLVRTGLPTVGFRSANAGYASSKGVYENRTYECYLFNPRWECDKAVAMAHEDGMEAFVALEASGIMEAAFQELGSQFYYGTSNDSLGFPGLLAAYDSTNMVVDAGGTADNVSTSVWAVKFGPRDVQWIYGQDGNLSLSDLIEARLTDGSSNPYTGLVQEILMHVGLQVGSTRSIARIKKLTTDSGKGVTDARIASCLALFQTGVKPDVLFMNRRSLEQLRASRTATNATGAPAPMPAEAFGVPILVTDSITSTETLAS